MPCSFLTSVIQYSGFHFFIYLGKDNDKVINLREYGSVLGFG